MAQIALISDIHGNMPALEAVLEDIERRNIRTIYCLGDIIGKGPSGDKAVDAIQKHCDKVVQGNWDEFVTKQSSDQTLLWHQSILGEERISYLQSLPFSIEFMMSGKYIRLFHASPRTIYERIQPWDSYEKRASLLESSDVCLDPRPADVAGYGDIHNAYMQHIELKTIFNVGSVGNPLDMTQASYAILEGELGREQPAPLNIQFIRVPYDIERAIREAEEANMPYIKEYSVELRTGIYRGFHKK